MSIDPGLIDMVMRLRGRGISSNAVLRAIELVPRRHFVPVDKRDIAYTDMSVPIGCGQTLPPPVTLALMAQMLDVQPDQKVLLVGSGSGYLAGVLSQMTTRIYAVERYLTLIKEADARYRLLGLTNIVTRHGDGRYGWPGQAAFDRIILGYGVRAEPEGLLEQLSPQGRLLGVVDEVLTRFDKSRKLITATEIMPLQLDMVEAGKSRTL
jgi:protein-L-isoaspartate(D-aspartate) O-methyltransferase